MRAQSINDHNTRRYILTGGSLGAALFLVAFVILAIRYPQMVNFDQKIIGFVRSLSSDWLTTVMRLFTTLGSAPVEFLLVLLVGSYLYWRLHYLWEPVFLVGTLSGSWILNELLKAFFQRARPDVLRLTQAGGYSFPSGHAMISFSIYGLLAYLSWLNLRRHSRFAWLPAVGLVALALVIGVSRVYLGVHYPSDVLAGYAAGGAWLITAITVLRVIRCRYSARRGA